MPTGIHLCYVGVKGLIPGATFYDSPVITVTFILLLQFRCVIHVQPEGFFDINKVKNEATVVLNVLCLYDILNLHVLLM